MRKLSIILLVTVCCFLACEKEDIPFVKDKNNEDTSSVDPKDTTDGTDNSGTDTSTPAPKIETILPNSGPKTTVVTISGNNFGSNKLKAQVFFNSIEGEIQSMSNTEIIAIVPAKAYTGKVTVKIDSKQAEGPIFNYIITDVYTDSVAGTISGNNDGTIEDAKFKFPYDAVYDSKGNIFIADRDNHKIRKITPEGQVTTFAGTGAIGMKNGEGAKAEFNSPSAIAIDKLDNIYVADFSNHCIRKITPQGVVSTFAGYYTSGNNDGIGLSARFNSPTGIVVDNSGNVYVADYGNHKIRKIDPNGNTTTIAGTGAIGKADGISNSATFNGPLRLTIDSAKTIFVSDHNNHRIRKITSDGIVSTIAGSIEGDKDGPGNDARFKKPAGIAVDTFGNIYVADFDNHKIKVITNGNVNTLAGSTAGDAIGTGMSSQLNQPIGISISPENHILIVDRNNHKIKKLTLE